MFVTRLQAGLSVFPDALGRGIMHSLILLLRLFSFVVIFVITGDMTILGYMSRANAQTVDLNIQSRIDTVAAPYQVQPIPIAPSQPARQPAFVAETTCYEMNRRCLSGPELDNVVNQQAKQRKMLTATPGGADLVAELKSAATPPKRKRQIVKKLGLPISIKPTKPTHPNEPPGPPAQPTAVKFTFPLSPMYETNATKSGTLPVADGSVSFGGGFLLTTQGFRNLDVIGISAGWTSTRYARLSSKGFDTLTASGQYQLFLGAYDVTRTMLDLSHGSNLPSGQVTFNTLSLGVQNSTSFAPTFRAETVDLVTPTIVYGWQNIPLDRGLCASRLDPKTSSFCYYTDVTVTLGHTLADVRSLDNTSLALSATLGNRIADTDLVIGLGGTVTGKVFDNVPGGRDDVMVQIGPKLQYTPLKNASAALAVTYNQNFSTLAPAAWHGWIFQSTLTLSF
jgi:hypothetical protein